MDRRLKNYKLPDLLSSFQTQRSENQPTKEAVYCFTTTDDNVGTEILGSIVVSIPACHAGDRGSIPRRGELFLFSFMSFFYRSNRWISSIFQKKNMK